MDMTRYRYQIRQVDNNQCDFVAHNLNSARRTKDAVETATNIKYYIYDTKAEKTYIDIIRTKYNLRDEEIADIASCFAYFARDNNMDDEALRMIEEELTS